MTVAHDVAQWCRDHEDDPLIWIALCGYEGEHDLPGWDVVAWKASGGYNSDHGHLERIWFSPNCPVPSQITQGDLFSDLAP
jgi:hypothetical protein